MDLNWLESSNQGQIPAAVVPCSVGIKDHARFVVTSHTNNVGVECGISLVEVKPHQADRHQPWKRRGVSAVVIFGCVRLLSKHGPRRPRSLWDDIISRTSVSPMSTRPPRLIPAMLHPSAGYLTSLSRFRLCCICSLMRCSIPA